LAVVFRGLASAVVALGALAPALPLASGPVHQNFYQWGPGISAAPVPASWEHVDRLEEVLISHGVPVVYRDSCPEGLEGLYDPRQNEIMMCRNTMPHRSENYWNTLAHESVHVMQVCRNASPLSVGLDEIQEAMLSSTPQREKLYILTAYPPEQRLYELEARWVANTFAPDAVTDLLADSCTASASRPATQALLPSLLDSSGV
jgi:hypothetical protein